MASKPHPDAAFDGFGKEALPFLKALGFHQDREWFHDNKRIYDEQLREPLIALVNTASERLQSAGVPLKGTRKSSLFRINRDIRFSKDKQPYNTHVSAVLTRTGDKKDVGGIYMHFGPDESFLASGLWFPPGPELRAMREQMVSRRDEFFDLAERLEKSGTPIGMEGGKGKLTRPPHGFADVDDQELMEWLKRKSFVATRPIKPARLASPMLVDDIVDFGETVLPFMQFVWRAVDPLREEDGNS